MSDKKENPMREIMIEKITLNVGVGEAGDKLEKAKVLLERIAGSKVVVTHAKRRIPSWGVRPGLAIGVKTTLRGEKAIEMLKRLFKAVDNTVNPKQFDEEGNLSFGIKEYIHIPEVKYDPSLGIIGLDVCITLKRKGGTRTKRRAYRTAKIGKAHRITKEEAMDFFKEKFGIYIGEKKRTSYY
ncbi:MAG: 50S ribosomal protein L5 [Nanoarchaeota archaeon]|nr:50S ribosomal protein L5 [Nanoarchaeota archaeon]